MNLLQHYNLFTLLLLAYGNDKGPPYTVNRKASILIQLHTNWRVSMQTRDAYYDNAKFLLIFLVVFGHLIQSFIHDSKFIFSLYTTIYSFHMPAFILIAGYFAKGFQKKGYFLKIAKKLIGPYLLFQGIYSVYYFFLQDKSAIELDPLNPQWSLWFLISLFCWNAMLYLFTKWKPVYSILIAFGLGIAIGYISEISNYLSLSRTIVFFPLFLIGYYFQKDHFSKLQTNKVKIVSFFILVSTFLVVYLLPELEYRWLFGSKPYEALDYGMGGGLVRFLIYGLTLLTTLSFLAIVPKQHTFFTKWGTRSLYVYLLHGFFIKYFRNSDLADNLHGFQELYLLILFSLLLTIVLSSNLIKTITQPIIEFKLPSYKNMMKYNDNQLRKGN